MTVVIAGVVGLLVGSFANVVALRVPAGKGVLGGRSACMSCDTTLTARDLVPVLSWVVLRRRCRHCGAGVHWQYPLVELVTALAFVGVVAGGMPAVMWPAAGWLLTGLIASSVVDIRTHRLPDRITAVTTIGVVVLTVGATLWTMEFDRLAVAGASAVVGFVVFFALHLATPGGFGAGDVKLVVPIMVVTGWLQWELAILSIVAAFGLGAILGVALLIGSGAFRRQQRHAMAFGPFMAAGAWVALSAGPWLIDSYYRIWWPVTGGW